MLLPLNSQAAFDISLANHLALAVCRTGQGSAHLINELNKTVFLTYHLQISGFGEAPIDLYYRADAALRFSAREAQRDKVWRLGAECGALLAEILAIHDRQLAEAPAWKTIEAKIHLSKFIRRKIRLSVTNDILTPIPCDERGLDSVSQT